MIEYVNMKASLLILTLLSGVIYSNAQSLTGIWRGTFYNVAELRMGGSKYRYEVQLNDGKKPVNNRKSVAGVTYSYQTTRFYAKASFDGIWTPNIKELVIRELKMEELKIAGGGDGCLMTCYLSYRKEGSQEYLEGSYTSVSMTTGKSCGGGKVFLEKVVDSDFEEEPFLKKNGAKPKIKPGADEFVVKKPATTAKPAIKPPVKTNTPPAVKPPVKKPPLAAERKPASISKDSSSAKPAATQPNKSIVENKALPQPQTKPLPPAVLKQRKNELFQTISTSASEISISFYDNGEIDGDTISVFDNNRLVVGRRGLTANPITLKIKMNEEEPEHEIVMVAENLGAIPPNTALMIVQAGSKRYTLGISSTEQKNAMVRFKYDAAAEK